MIHAGKCTVSIFDLDGNIIEVNAMTESNFIFKNNRPSKKDYYLEIAKAVARRSTCLRRQYGAVIVKDDQIISTGYNGAARGEENCCDAGECWRQANGIPHGEQYEKCVAVHAEANAILSADRAAMIGATLYLAGFENGRLIKAEPCAMCARLIKNARIAEVVGTERAPWTNFSVIADGWRFCEIEMEMLPPDLMFHPVFVNDVDFDSPAFIVFGKLDNYHWIALVNPFFIDFLEDHQEININVRVLNDTPGKIIIGSHQYKVCLDPSLDI